MKSPSINGRLKCPYGYGFRSSWERSTAPYEDGCGSSIGWHVISGCSIPYNQWEVRGTIMRGRISERHLENLWVAIQRPRNRCAQHPQSLQFICPCCEDVACVGCRSTAPECPDCDCDCGREETEHARQNTQADSAAPQAQPESHGGTLGRLTADDLSVGNGPEEDFSDR